jgi:hypothetical protein
VGGSSSLRRLLVFRSLTRREPKISKLQCKKLENFGINAVNYELLDLFPLMFSVLNFGFRCHNCMSQCILSLSWFLLESRLGNFLFADNVFVLCTQCVLAFFNKHKQPQTSCASKQANMGYFHFGTMEVFTSVDSKLRTQKKHLHSFTLTQIVSPNWYTCTTFQHVLHLGNGNPNKWMDITWTSKLFEYILNMDEKHNLSSSVHWSHLGS